MTDERDPILEVARDLRAIVDLHADLPDQAAHRATNHDMPGGDATVMLAPVASPEAWLNRVDTELRTWFDSDRYDGDPRHAPLTAAEDAEPNWEPPLQTLLFWSEAWRYEHDATTDLRPTIETEAAWLSGVIGWAYDHEPHFEDFARDVHTARVRLEALLRAGDKTEHGMVPCGMCGGELDRDILDDKDDRPVRRDCDCPPPVPHAQHGVCNCRRVLTLVLEDDPRDPLNVVVVPRVTPDAEPHAHQHPALCCLACRREAIHSRHDQGGLRDRWVCRRCERAFGLDEYRSAVARDARDNATALPVHLLQERFEGITVGQVRMWASRGFVRKHGRDEMGRMLYDVADVETRRSAALA